MNSNEMNEKLVAGREPSALRMGQGRTGRSLRTNTTPQRGLVRTGEPPKIVVPRRQSTPQRAVFEWGRSPGRQAGARLPTFFRCAEARPAASSGRDEKRTGREMDSSGGRLAAKKIGSRAFAAPPGKKDFAFGRPDRKFPRSPVLTGFAEQMGMVQKLSRSPTGRRLLTFVQHISLYCAVQRRNKDFYRGVTE